MIKTRKSHQYFLQIYTFILSSKGLMFSKNDGISIFLNICTSTHFVLNIIIFKILQNSLQWLEWKCQKQNLSIIPWSKLRRQLHFIICKPWFFAIVTENRATAEEVPMYSCNNLNSNTDNLTAKDIEVLIY